MDTQITSLAPENFIFKHKGATPTLQLYPLNKTSSWGIGKNDNYKAIIIINDDQYLRFNYDYLGFD